MFDKYFCENSRSRFFVNFQFHFFLRLWQQLVLFEKGFKDQKGCSLAPQTCSLLEKYMLYSATKCQRGQIKFSVMHSGTHVQPHNGPTNTRLRAHLGLLIPDEGGLVEMRIADKRLKWSDGKIFVIDDRYLSFTCTIHLWFHEIIIIFEHFDFT